MMNKSRSNEPRAIIAILHYLLTVNSIVFDTILIPGKVIYLLCIYAEVSQTKASNKLTQILALLIKQ